MRHALETYADKCAGCLSWQLAYSFTKEGALNPVEARITVHWTGFDEVRGSFTEDCDLCAIRAAPQAETDIAEFSQSCI